MEGVNPKYLFWACWVALVATAFVFIVRAQILSEWGTEFNLDNTQLGRIGGAGLWPFAFTIVLFSLIIDKIGYGRAMAFAWVCHVASVILTVTATNYTMLYIGTIVAALGNGTVEAVINPVVATMFAKDKVKWLNILHAGWPGGLVMGGVFALAMGDVSWKWKVGLLLIPTVIYGVMLFGRKFPVHERVTAGVSYHDMLKELGALGVLIIAALMIRELGTDFEFGLNVQLVILAAVVLGYWAYVRSLGRPLLILLMLVMLPLATTELGTDGWITDLLTPAAKEMGMNAGWVLVYTSAIMMVLRFSAGPIVHRIQPLGLLAVSSVLGIFGLLFLSKAEGAMIFAAATLYGMGKSFFWPTTLGIVSEQFPKGGALTLNTIAGVGMIGVGIVGNVFIGAIQDRQIVSSLEKENPAIHAKVIGEEKTSVFGKYRAVDQDKIKALPDADKTVVTKTTDQAKKSALGTMALFPCVMLASYLILIVYFRSRGGYKPVALEGSHG
jgi:MFS family permease